MPSHEGRRMLMCMSIPADMNRSVALEVNDLKFEEQVQHDVFSTIVLLVRGRRSRTPHPGCDRRSARLSETTYGTPWSKSERRRDAPGWNHIVSSSPESIKGSPCVHHRSHLT